LILAIFKEVTGAKIPLTDIVEIYFFHRVKLINCIPLPARDAPINLLRGGGKS